MDYTFERVTNDSFQKERLEKKFWFLNEDDALEQCSMNIYKVEFSKDSIKYLTLANYFVSEERDILTLGPYVHVYKSWMYHANRVKYGLHIYMVQPDGDTVLQEINIKKEDYYKLVGK